MKTQMYGDEIISYSTPHSRGLVHIYRESKERTEIACAIKSTSGHLAVGFNFTLRDKHAANAFQIIEPILATVVFDEGVNCDSDDIAKIIADAGIPAQE
jgi:hypothetical protein